MAHETQERRTPRAASNDIALPKITGHLKAQFEARGVEPIWKALQDAKSANLDLSTAAQQAVGSGIREVVC
jgi:hypothetical protein